MKISQQNFDSPITFNSNELVKLEDLSLSQIAGGGGPSKSGLSTENVSFNYTQTYWSYLSN